VVSSFIYDSPLSTATGKFVVIALTLYATCNSLLTLFFVTPFRVYTKELFIRMLGMQSSAKTEDAPVILGDIATSRMPIAKVHRKSCSAPVTIRRLKTINM